MLQVAYQRWEQSPEDLRLFAQEAPHRRTRERFLALYELTQGKNATQVAKQIGREDETVHNWVHRYNERGAESLIFKRSGGRPPFARSPAVARQPDPGCAPGCSRTDGT